jgi:hypothetical protein
MLLPDVWWSQLVWVLAGGGLGFAVAAVFARMLRMNRTAFLVPYATTVGLFLYAYIGWSGIDFTEELTRHWTWGLVGAVLVGLLLVKNVMSQPAYPRSEGAVLVFEIAWWGIVYGVLDALFLSVMPVLATWQAFGGLPWSDAWYGKVLAGVVALVASSYITAAYHLGYPEFQSTRVVLPLAGNGIVSLAYLLTKSPLAAIGSHAAMHVAAVWLGAEGTVQLPPHPDVGRAAASQQSRRTHARPVSSG